MEAVVVGNPHATSALRPTKMPPPTHRVGGFVGRRDSVPGFEPRDFQAVIYHQLLLLIL
jgi:hypothetical protein